MSEAQTATIQTDVPIRLYNLSTLYHSTPGFWEPKSVRMNSIRRLPEDTEVSQVTRRTCGLTWPGCAATTNLAV